MTGYCDDCAWPEECAAHGACQRPVLEPHTEPHDTNPRPIEIACLVGCLFMALSVDYPAFLLGPPTAIVQVLAIGLASALAVWVALVVKALVLKDQGQ